MTGERKYLPNGQLNPAYKTRPSGRRLHTVTRIARDPRYLVAIDGEGVSDPDGKHRYTLLAGYTIEGDGFATVPLTGANELSTYQCLASLFSVPKDRSIVGFSLGYDVAMWMRDLSRIDLAKLAAGQTVFYRGFAFKWLPRKEFWVKKDGESRTIYDVFGYFQTSFVNALRDWEVGSPEQIERIADMKAQRGEFIDVSPEKVAEYCKEECVLLCKLMHRLLSLFDAASLYPARLSGVGPLAGFKLKQERVQEYLARPETPETIGWHAYFGGRFDVAEAGRHKNVIDYDINSAYPFCLASLPCLAHGEWNQCAVYDPAAAYACWHIEWFVPPDTRWPPFPWREQDGMVYYPCKGKGWYWQSEIAAGIEIIEQAGGTWKIDYGIIYEPSCEHKPFGFIPTLYELRRKYKAEGNPVEKPLKLVYNSCYGKTAQTVGFVKREDGTVKPPTWQSTVWAGMVTSGTRSQILRAILCDPGAVTSIATDGIVSTRPLTLTEGDGLGQWKATPHTEAWLIQPGLYWYPDEDKTKTRGHSPRDLDWKSIITEWRKLEWIDNKDAGWQYHTSKFIGIALGLRGGVYTENFRRWRELSPTIKFRPARRIIGSSKSYVKRTQQCVWYASPWHGAGESTKYRPHKDWESKHAAEVLEEMWQEDQP